MENAEIINLIEKLASKFGFNVEEAKAYCAESSSDSETEKVKLSPIEKTRKNLETWNKKLQANKFKDEDAKQKLEEKIAKEEAKLEKLENPPEAKPKAAKPKAAPKKSEKTEEAPKAPKKVKKEEEKVEETESKTTPKKSVKTEEAPKAPKKVKKEEETETKPEKKEEVKTESKAKKEENVRIKRMSVAQNKQLTEALTKAGMDMTDERKREFVKFVEELSDDDFKAKGLIDHMRDFADSISEKMPPLAEEDADQLTLDELQAIKMTATLSAPVGTYWDADKGRYVTGPDEDDDEDCVLTTFEGKEYRVGEKTGRVYSEVNNRDVFLGFIGVGGFKAMKPKTA